MAILIMVRKKCARKVTAFLWYDFDSAICLIKDFTPKLKKKVTFFFAMSHFFTMCNKI